MDIKPKSAAALMMTGGTASLGGRLRQEFDAARFGHYFRTQTLFNTVTQAKEWLYAVQDTHSRRCIVMKVRESENGEEERLPVKENVPFIETLNQLSRFETLSLNPSLLPTDEEEVTQLGTAHFNAFANREGLIRDQDSGDYAPTLNGHVVTKGIFNRGDLVRTMNHAQKPPAQTEKFIVPDHHKQEPFASSIAQIMALYNTQEQIQRMIVYHTALSQITTYTLNGKRSFELDNICPEFYSYDRAFSTLIDNEYDKMQEKQGGIISGKIAQMGQYLRITNSPQHYDRLSIYTFFRILEKLRNTPFVDQTQAPLHNRILLSHEAAYEFSLCRYYAKGALDSSTMSFDHRQALSDRLESRLKNLGRMADKTGLDPVMKSALIASVHGDNLPRYFEEIKDFVAKLHICKQQIDNDISVARQRQKDLAP